MMVADIVLVSALALPVILVGLVAGVSLETGVLGLVGVVVLSALWGLAFTGFPYAIALKTGNPAAVNTSFLLFFPFAFLTTSFVPRESLSGWMDTAASWNPVTYVLEGMRALISGGWEWGPPRQGAPGDRDHGHREHVALLRGAAWSPRARLTLPLLQLASTD